VKPTVTTICTSVVKIFEKNRIYYYTYYNNTYILHTPKIRRPNVYYILMRCVCDHRRISGEGEEKKSQRTRTDPPEPSVDACTDKHKPNTIHLTYTHIHTQYYKFYCGVKLYRFIIRDILYNYFIVY